MNDSDDTLARLLLDKAEIRERIAELAFGTGEDDAPTCAYLTSHISDIDGDEAQAQTYGIVVARGEDGIDEIAGIRFLDRLERRPDGWAVAERSTLTEWVGGHPRQMRDAGGAR